ncbi:hypothetical protein EEL32_11495 [Brevibacillus laterosporus]|nr:hypothetical protein [Brevibacillus laterosporus]TPG70517.1 hypothetical protein EEL31_19910 [Brevibacillus laterosporus]TPG87743.1 hypothetical protein EEL32_11495 [Brevibacillus laterosporus]
MTLVLKLTFLAALTVFLFISYFFTFNNVSIKVKKKKSEEQVINWAGFQKRMLLLSTLLTIFYVMYFIQIRADIGQALS